MRAFDVTWDEGGGLVTTRVRRALSVDEAIEYGNVLTRTLGGVPVETSFVWLSNSTGYEPLANRGGHQIYRSILPHILAEHGLRTSLLDLYEGDVAVTCSRGVTCRAIAHIHHDVEKMAIFDGRFGRENERYFSDESAARKWLSGR